jgi:hypothetical protein
MSFAHPVLADVAALLADVARDGDVGALLDLVRGDHDVYDVEGQARAWSEGSEVDDLEQEIKDAKTDRDEAVEKFETEEAAHEETKADLAEARATVEGLEEEIEAIRQAQRDGEPLPPPRPAPPPVDVGVVAAQALAERLLALSAHYGAEANKLGRRTAAGKAADKLAVDLCSAAGRERRKALGIGE